MSDRIITKEHLAKFERYLLQEEKSSVTIQKYLRDVQKFMEYMGGEVVTKELTVAYKKKLEDEKYALRSINSMLASVNSILEYFGWTDCKVKNLKQQRQIFNREEKELTKEEYQRLLYAAKGKEQLQLVIQTICGTGIRVSELKYFTVESLHQGAVSVQCKNKTRLILIPHKLKLKLLDYIRRKDIRQGVIFVTRNGNPLDRSNIWSQMKKLCEKAGVLAEKVFPHNLRKLFARTFYSMEKDIAKLADILGHSNIETTRIYIMTTCVEHLNKLEKMQLII